MQVLWLDAIGHALELRDVPTPTAVPGAVVVEVVSVRVPSNTRSVVDGSARYDLPVPLVPGPTCIGKVVEVGSDVFDLKIGELVLCNSLLSSGDATGATDDILIGWTGNGSERGHAMQAVWRHGSFAQRALYPVGCVIPLSGAELFDKAKLPFVASLAIADGAIQRGMFEGGQTVIINGATGQLGSAAVMLAIARGAGRIVAVGRNKQRLATLSALSDRVAAVALTGDARRDVHGVKHAANGGADLLLDYLADTPTPQATASAIEALRPGGTAVLTGGVKSDLPINYARIMRNQLTIRGSFMFSRSGALSTWNLVRSGALSLQPVRSHGFGLADIDEAMTVAATLGGTDMAVLLPNG